jgi:Ser-tRNA(Ala) deacylase AlaX
MPGRVRVYRCECGQEVRSIEITVDRLTAGLDLYQENIQRHIRKNAELKEKLDWMKRPVNMRQHKIERLRAKIIELLDITF